MKTVNWLALTLAAAVTAGGLFTSNALAADSPAPPPRLRARLMERVKEQLGLSDEQAARIRDVLKADKDNLTALLARVHDARVGLRQAIQAPGASEAGVRAASATVAAAEADFAVERLRLYGKISPILTADQLDKLNQFQARVDEFVDRIISRVGERLTE